MTVPVQKLYPDWPDVRCADCGTVYQAAETSGLVTANCPTCGAGKFNTTMSGSVSTVDVPAG